MNTEFKSSDAYRLMAYGILGVTAAVHAPWWAFALSGVIFVIAMSRMIAEVQAS